MATIEKEIPPQRSVSADGLNLSRPYRWTRSKYEKLIEHGVFDPDDRLELLRGVIVEKMPQNSYHSTSLTLMQEALRTLFAADHVVRGQLPLNLDDFSQPEPDIAVVRGAVRDYTDRQPGSRDAVLVVEISDSTLATDRRTKAALYAQAMIPEYWIVNVEARVLEVYRQPGPSDERTEIFAYRQIASMAETDTVAPLAFPDAVLRVADILP